jgi:hypothetical protein
MRVKESGCCLNLRYSSGTFLERLRLTKDNLIRDSWRSGRDFIRARREVLLFSIAFNLRALNSLEVEHEDGRIRFVISISCV